MPYYGQHEILFPHVEGKNIFIFHGENSKGKTSIAHAIRWVLYGKTEEKLDDREQEVPESQLINSDAEREGEASFEVTIDFEHQGTKYELTRKATKDKSTREWKNDSLMKKSGEPITHSVMLSTINSITPYEAHKFFLFDGERLDSFKKLLSAEKGASRLIKDSIEDVLGIPALVSARDEFEGIIRKYTGAERNALKQQAADTAAVKENERLNARREDLKSSEENLRKRIKKDEEDIQKIEQVNTENKDWIENIEQEKELNRRIDGLTESKKQAEEEIRKSRGDIWKSVVQSVVEQKSRDQQKHISKQTRLTKEYNSADIMIEMLQKIEKENVCPTCNRSFEIQEKQQKELVELKARRESITQELNRLPINTIWKKLDDKFRNVASIDEIQKLETNVETIDLEIIAFGKEIDNLKKDRGEIAVSETELERNNSLRDKLLENNGTNKNRLENIEKDLTQVNKDLAMNKLDEGSETNERLASANKKKLDVIALSEIFDSAIDVLRTKLKDEVEERATEAFRNLTNRPEDYNRLKITDSYGMHIIDKSGEIVPMRSAGAEQIVALSLITGLNLTGKSPGPLVIDTPFARLDVNHRLNIMEYLP